LLDAGAAHVIATDDQDLVKEILKITNGKGGRIIFDPVGGPTIAKLTQAMAGFGTLFIYGALDEIQFIYGALDEIQRAHFAVGGELRVDDGLRPNRSIALTPSYSPHNSRNSVATFTLNVSIIS
jgi:NADPH:quinone reductase-like Zn-dependent oxidoreductase